MQAAMGVSERVRVLGAAAVLVVFGALSACGGGGGHDAPPLEVTVSVDGVADTAHPLTAGGSATISVPSGATLVFDSEGQARWAPVATNSSFHVNSFSFTSKSLTVTSHTGGSLVVVFKDKADETKTATLTVTVAPKEFERVARVDGEIETWSQTWVNGDGSSTHANVLRRTVLVGDGYAIDLGDPGTPGVYTSRQLYDTQDRYLGFVFPQSDSACTYDNPVAYVSYPLHVGKTWSGSARRTCTSGSTFVQSYERSVQAYERITVPQGTHDALRITAEVSYTGILPSQPDYTLTRTCWWAVDLGRDVKCEFVYHLANGGSQTQTETLTGLTR